MFIADLHVHSNYSDGALSIPQLVDFYGSRGFGCIAVTDHVCERNTVMGLAARYMNVTLTRETFSSYIAEIREQGVRAWEQYGMLLLPGVEITKNTFSNHRSAHILGIGVHEFIDAEGDATDLARRIRDQGALAVAAHPVRTFKAEIQTQHLWDRRAELAAEFDAWEVASGADIFPEVAESRLAMIATSDFHRDRDMTGWKTVFECEKSVEALAEAVRRQRVSFRYFEDPVPCKKWA